MTNLGTPTRGPITIEELLRTALNKILEDEIKSQGLKQQQPIAAVTVYETVTMSHTEPVITTTTSLTDTYDSATAKYEHSEHG